MKPSFLLCWLLLGFLPAIAQNYPSFEKRSLIRNQDTLLYRVQFPFHYNPDKKYPLVLFLHGAGERGNDNEAQLFWGATLFSDSANRSRYPAIVIFPQCPKEEFWALLNLPERPRVYPADIFTVGSGTPPGKALALVMELLDSLLNSGSIKSNRIYLGGLSMGGMGTFELLWRRPSLFAAALPICGGGDPDRVSSYAPHTAVWAFHGDKDPVVPPELSRIMVEALKKAGGRVKYSEYPGVGHDSWKNAFSEPELLPWLFRQKRRR